MSEVVLTRVERVFPVASRASAGQFRLGPLDLTLPDGQLTVLAGPSGCGKTTMLRLIAGLESPTSGQISIGGRSVEGISPRQRDVAMVFQDHALYPQMTVFGNLAFPLKMRRLAKAEIRARVKEAAAWLDLEPLLDRRPAQLSGGQQQRVALGRAIVRRPRVSLLDEPLAHLDAPLRAELREMLGSIQRRLGLAMLYVTHDQAEATAIGDRVVVMNQGRIEQAGPPEAIYDAPANRFVAGFFGAARMNFFDGLLRECPEGRLFVSLEGLCVPLSDALAGAAGPCSQRVTLGIRPQDVRVEVDGAKPESLTASVKSIQVCDGRRLARLETQGCRIEAELPRSISLRPGDSAAFQFPVERLFLFDASGGTLAAPGWPRAES